MRRRLLPLLALLLPLALHGAAPATAASDGRLAIAVFTDATGAYPATFRYDGACWGSGTVTLTIHRPTGPDVRVVPVWSFSLDICGDLLACADCPPVPQAYTWTLENLAQNVLLHGGGPSAYYQYQTTPLAYALAGTFQEGVLEAAGTI